MQEHSINTEKFSAIWIPSYGSDSGYFESKPKTDLDYDLHQYTSKGKISGFDHNLDINLISSEKEKEEILLRTHTSPVQARAMDAHDFSKGPLKMISPGRVFRRDTDDATHSHQFHQIEGLVVGKNISMADLQGTLQLIVQKMFGEERQIRLRPSYFPFTEPSVEVDVSCFKCGGEGCNVCKKTGWIEIMGAGMVHPRVLEMSGIDATVYSGFAFGLGQERVAMLRYGINDIRGFYQGDVRFSEQFK